MRKLFISGPMSGIPEHNFPAFFEAERELKKAGWCVYSAARMAIAYWVNHHFINDIDDWSRFIGTEAEKNIKPIDYLRTNISLISTCDAIVLLPGWERHNGPGKDFAVAHILDLEIYELKSPSVDMVRYDEYLDIESRR